MAIHKTTNYINIIDDYGKSNKLIKMCINSKQSSTTPVYIVHISILNIKLCHIDVRNRQVSYKYMEYKIKMIHNL